MEEEEANLQRNDATNSLFSSQRTKWDSLSTAQKVFSCYNTVQLWYYVHTHTVCDLSLWVVLDTDNQLNEEQDEGQYRNVKVVNSIDSPTLQMVKRLRELKPSESEETKVR